MLYFIEMILRVCYESCVGFFVEIEVILIFYLVIVDVVVVL